MRFIAGVLKGLVAIAMMGAVVIVAVFIYASVSKALTAVKPAVDTSTSGAQSVVFTIKPGETVDQIANNLQQQGIIDSTLWFKLKYKTGSSDKTLKAGSFQVTKGMDLDQLITVLSTPPGEAGIKFTVIEGTRLEEIAGKLSSQGIVSATQFIQLAGTPAGASSFSDDFIAASGKPADKGLEGFLFPDTYEIKQAQGDNSQAVIKTMLAGMENKLTPDLRQAIAASGHNTFQVLTMASIVQREGVVPEELPTIASVFWNRIDKGMTLGADPTTQYAVAKEPDWWPNLDQLGIQPNTVNNPYNTYVVQGLPPGPICNPGLAAIKAAISPAQTDYLYFVAKNDGTSTHAFARTYEEHQRNIIIYSKNK
ncbi:MAG: endolytic transglycosylase MltG [Actinomycetota bacterium]|nr:endolytic transglycosylase MltG [Actinomycetota bacterium]